MNNTDPLLHYATSRIIELEQLLLVEVVETSSPGDIFRNICHIFESKQDMCQGGTLLQFRKMLTKLILNTAVLCTP